MENEFEIKTSDGVNISASYTNANSSCVVIWLHGITVDKDEYLDFFKDGAEYLFACGISSLRIDFRGHGKSGSSSLDFSPIGQILDVQACIEYLIDEFRENNLSIILVGCSFGAPPSIYIANRYPDLIKGVVLVSPVLDYKKTFLEPTTDWAKSIFNEESFNTLKETGRLYIDDEFPVSPRFVEEMRLLTPEKFIHKVRQKIIIIHGDHDSMVPFSVSEEVALNDDNIKLVTIPNMDHGFMDKDDEEGVTDLSINNKNMIYEIIKNACNEE